MQTGFGAPPPDPGDAKTIVQFVDRMRELKAWSGRSYRQLERNASRHGEHLSYSTLAGALSRNQLPREELLRAFVLACGCDTKTAAAWVGVRQTLAMRALSEADPAPVPGEPLTGETAPLQTAPGELKPDEAVPGGPRPDEAVPGGSKPHEAVSGGPGPGEAVPIGPEAGDSVNGVTAPVRAEQEPGDGVPGAGSRPEPLKPRPGWGRTRSARFVGVTTLLLSGGMVIAALTDRWPFERSPGSAVPGTTTSPATGSQVPAASKPAVLPGAYRLRLAHSRHCLSEREDSKGRILQMPCDQAYPPMTLRAEADGTYRVTTVHPSEGPGCMGIRYANKAPGPFVYDDFCESTNSGGERFRVEAVTAPVRGFRIRPAHNKLCFGVPGGSRKVGDPVWQSPCDPAALDQVILLEPRWADPDLARR
ncbi:hypothetical protein [Sphaerisporangium sp. TRM90804]|uniref:RICIN domain-containing protein n=1 Tax=Sphaerisporangium sp. TRM90804 TaxID=3031113 RepID=UPI0024478FBB|nr:hypothetical protein [Sphaerisporangium sp. TRM90804]MDH2428493.1 hypothetical protein [Sphaerisporangium sp. TRM90804]